MTNAGGSTSTSRTNDGTDVVVTCVGLGVYNPTRMMMIIPKKRTLKIYMRSLEAMWRLDWSIDLDQEVCVGHDSFSNKVSDQLVKHDAWGLAQSTSPESFQALEVKWFVSARTDCDKVGPSDEDLENHRPQHGLVSHLCFRQYLLLHSISQVCHYCHPPLRLGRAFIDAEVLREANRASVVDLAHLERGHVICWRCSGWFVFKVLSYICCKYWRSLFTPKKWSLRFELRWRSTRGSPCGQIRAAHWCCDFVSSVPRLVVYPIS